MHIVGITNFACMHSTTDSTDRADDFLKFMIWSGYWD